VRPLIAKDMHKSFFGKDDPEILIWQADTRTMNPTISESMIQRELEKDPVSALAEWFGSFRQDISAAFPLEAIEACTIPGRRELMPALEHYLAFADPSGGRHDQFTLAIAHLHGDETVVLDCIRATKPPFDPGEVVKDYVETLKRYRVSGVTGDNYGGEWPKAEFAKHGIDYRLSEKHKSDLYLSLIPVLTSRRVELLENDKLITELRRLERRRGRSGKDSIDHGARGSDDVANAVAGVVDVVLTNGAADLDDYASYGDRASAQYKYDFSDENYSHFASRKNRFDW